MFTKYCILGPCTVAVRFVPLRLVSFSFGSVSSFIGTLLGPMDLQHTPSMNIMSRKSKNSHQRRRQPGPE